jgi:hypothetical protein
MSYILWALHFTKKWINVDILHNVLSLEFVLKKYSHWVLYFITMKFLFLELCIDFFFNILSGYSFEIQGNNKIV